MLNICYKRIDAYAQDMDYLRELTRLFFEDLEKNGPPEWLAINTHKIWHWVDLLLRFGPVREWWMYAFESMNGKLARWVKNNAYPVPSIMNGIRRLKMLYSLRGILSMLLKREKAARGRVPRPLMAGPNRGIIVTTYGDKGTPMELTSSETDEITRWMGASIPAYRKLFQQHAEYDVYRRRCSLEAPTHVLFVVVVQYVVKCFNMPSIYRTHTENISSSQGDCRAH